jgi:hypothetical protein
MPLDLWHLDLSTDPGSSPAENVYSVEARSSPGVDSGRFKARARWCPPTSGAPTDRSPSGRDLQRERWRRSHTKARLRPGSRDNSNGPR